MGRELSQDSKEQLACALIMLKEWKFLACENFEEKIEMMKYVVALADAIGVKAEFEDLLSKASFEVKER